MNAAAELFMAQGFSTSMDEIAAAAHVSKRTLYQRYPSKPQLYEAVLTWLNGDLARPAAMLDEQLDLRTALRTFCDHLFDLYTRPKVVRFWRLMQKEAERFRDIEISSRRQFVVNIRQPLKAFLDARVDVDLKPVDTGSLAYILCSIVVTELTRMHVQGDFDRSAFRAYIHSAVDILAQGAERPNGREGDPRHRPAGEG